MGSPQVIQGLLFGPVGHDGKVTGNNVAYIYPRSRIALFGKFRNNQMISAQETKIKKISCKNNLLSIEFEKPKGPFFHRSISTNSSFGDMPLIQVL